MVLLAATLAGCGGGGRQAAEGAPATATPSTTSPTPGATGPTTPTAPAPSRSAAATVRPGVILSPRPQHSHRQSPQHSHGSHHRHGTGPTVPAAPLVSEPFTVASFNTLGSVHTGRGGNKPAYAAGTVRTLRMIRVLRQHAVDLVGLQEFESPQASAFGRHAPQYAYWHPAGNSQNAIAWRRDRFALVSAQPMPVHYFSGNIQPMPIVLLRDLHAPSFEFYVVNVHNPASTRQHPGNQRWRSLDMVREAAVIRGLLATGRPVIFTGDMNEKAQAFCAFTRGGNLQAAAGGSNDSGRCRPPAGAKIDWIFGSQRVLFSGYRVDRSALVRRTTDHSVVLSEAQLVSSGS